MTTKFDARQTRFRQALSQLTGAAGSQLDAVGIAIDAQLAKLFQDRNVLLVGGGIITYTGGTDTVAFGAALKLEFNSNATGAAPVIVDLAATSRTFTADGAMLYAVVDRSAGTATVTANAATLPAQTSANQEVFLIAKRRDVAGVKTIYFRNGTVIEQDQSTSLDSTIASGIDVDSALPLLGTAADASLMVALTQADADMAKLHEDRNVVLSDGGFVTYLGTTVQFTESLKLHINSKIAGGSPVIIDLGSTTRTISADGRMIYAVIDRVAGTATVTADAATLPAVVAANKEVFLIAKRIDAGGGVKRLYFRNGAAFNEGQSARLGSAGSGSGGGNPILESLKNQFVDSPYELVTPNIMATDAATKFATLTGAAYDIVNGVIQFTANAQVATSVQMLDTAEFLANGLDVGSVDLSVFWNDGTTLQAFAIPTAFTYEVSRDGGSNWFPMTVARIGSTDTFRGTLRFDTTTTTEATKQTISTQAIQDANRPLNATTQQAVGQAFTLTTTTKLQEVVLSLAKAGSPSGSLYVSIVRDSAGAPSTSLSDVVCQSNAVSISGIAAGPANVTIDIPDVVLVAGTYHIVVSTDATYKSSFVSTTTEIRLREKQAGPSAPFTRVFNGTAYSIGSPNGNLTYTINGRALDLRVRITSAGSPTYPCGLDGFGIFYSLSDVGVVGSSRKNQRFVFNSVTDNLNSFAITAFNPDPDLLTCYWVEGGQVFKSPAFQLNGNTAVFPTGSFNNGGVSQAMTLIFDQNNGGAFDNSDSNARLLASNFLGSTNGADDRSSAGRGIFLRRPDGTLREIVLNNNDEFEIYSV